MSRIDTTAIEKHTIGFKSGNEMAALAASQVNYHIMGYYPITPSTEIAEQLDEMYAKGGHDIHLIPGDGEHGAAGICFGASTGGGRVFNATSSNGLIYSLEQLPVQSGSRFPMVLNVVARAVSGPLDIRCDHSDIMMTLNTGWIILLAKDPQAVYDMNIMAVKIGEHKDVRLPVIVAYDGFFTSHQKRRINYFEDPKVVQDFIGEYKTKYTSIDPENPVTIGPYMNDPDLINNKKQLSLAMETAYNHVIPEVFEEYYQLSGRRYNMIDKYQADDADALLFILNSAADTGKEAVDILRREGKKVGMIMPSVIRPFPAKEIASALRDTKAVLVADRQDCYGAWGGNMTLEVKAALKDDIENRTLVLSRIYGLGGKEFFVSDAKELLETALETAQRGTVKVPFEYFGANKGDEDYILERLLKPITKEETTLNKIKIEQNDDGRLDVKGVSAKDMTAMPKRIASGHGACPGCGIFSSIDLFLKGIEGHVVLLFHTGCGMVVTTGYPYSAHRVTYIHNLFQNGAATMSGVVEMFHEKKRRGELPADLDITFVMISGDGGMDIGMGPAIGTALRNHKMIILEYDNQGYMNTGCQLSFTTPYGHLTSTSHVGPKQFGKTTHHKDTAQIMAACHIPYVFTAAESNYRDLIKKGAKAQHYSKEGMVYGKVFSACPLNWRSDEKIGSKIVQAAIDSKFFPLYEIEHGVTTLNYDPEEKGKVIPMIDWLKMMGKTKHLTKPEYKKVADNIQAEVDRRWKRIKAMNENPLL